jgi:hypothetical protein
MTESKGSVLTEKQAQKIEELSNKEKITEKQKEELDMLIAKRDAPPKLSDTCVSYLKEVYIYNKYGKEPVGGSERSKYTLKGRAVEHESIFMLNRIDSDNYVKNEQRFTNEYLTGEPDIIILGEDGNASKIIDIKSSYDFATLLSNYGNSLNPLYHDQVQGYMALTGATEAEVCYCLVNMPQEIIEGEKRRVFYIMNPATEESVDYKKEIERIEFNMTFDEIPINERLLRFKVAKDDAFINRVYARIDECRKWLADFEYIHENMYKLY